MSLISRALTTAGAVAVAVGTLATPASAVGPICRQVTTSGRNQLTVCFTVEHNLSGATVAPYLLVQCGGYTVECEIPPVSVGTTGFVLNPSFPLPTVDPATGSVHIYAGTVGTLWADGLSQDIGVPDLCVGDPSYC
jgi:hypothetical protein